MEKVAEHINEMQRIHEEYGAIFDHLFRQHQKACKQPIDLSPGMSQNRLHPIKIIWAKTESEETLFDYKDTQSLLGTLKIHSIPLFSPPWLAINGRATR